MFNLENKISVDCYILVLGVNPDGRTGERSTVESKVDPGIHLGQTDLGPGVGQLELCLASRGMT